MCTSPRYKIFLLLICCFLTAGYAPAQPATLPFDEIVIALKRAGSLPEKADLELQAAIWWNEHGNYPKALSYAKQSMKNSLKTSDQLGYAKALNQAARAEGYLGDLDLAIKHGQNASHILEELGDTLDYGYALNTTAAYLIRKGDINAGRALLIRALQQEAPLRRQRPWLLEKICVNISISYISEGDDFAGENHCKRCLTIGGNNGPLNVTTYILLSDIYNRKQQWQEMIKHYLLGLELSEAKRDTQNIVLLSLLIGDFYRTIGHNKQINKYIEQVKNLSIHMSLSPPIQQKLLMLQGEYQKTVRKDYKKAQIYFNEALKLSLFRSKDTRAYIYGAISENYIFLGLLDSAENCIDTLGAIAKTTNNSMRSSEYNHNKGLLAIKRHAFDEARLCFLKALEASKEANTIVSGVKIIKDLINLDSLHTLKPGELEQFAKELITLTERVKAAEYDIDIIAMHEATKPLDQEIAQQKAKLLEKKRESQQRLVLILGISVIALLLLLATLLYRSKMRNSQKKNIEMQQNIREAQLKALRAQMNPHFLFNLFGSIENRIEIEPDEAQQMVSCLAKMMRKNLELSDESLIPLSEEIAYIKNYCQLMQLNLLHNFTCNIDVAQTLDTYTTLIPSMLIQPVVENAIIHGMKGMENGGHIQIDIKLAEPGVLECIVTDNGKGISTELRPNHKSFGRGILLNRLNLYSQMLSKNLNLVFYNKTDENGDILGLEVKFLIPYF